MKKLLKIALLGCGLAIPALSFADNTPNCDALDEFDSKDTHIDTDMDFNGGDIVFRTDGKVTMMITEDRELFLDGEQVELDARGQELVGEYYMVFEEFIDDVADIAGDAAGLGASAAIEAIAMIFQDDSAIEDFEARVEAKAGLIEARADDMCGRLRRIETIERELQQIVPGFEPHLFAQR